MRSCEKRWTSPAREPDVLIGHKLPHRRGADTFPAEEGGGTGSEEVSRCGGVGSKGGKGEGEDMRGVGRRET